MKKVLSFFAVLLVSVFSLAGGPPPSQYWVCAQPGAIEDISTLALSKFVDSSDDYEKKEVKFEHAVKIITKDRFEPNYSAMCRNFEDDKKADEYLKKMLKSAKKRDFTILWVPLKSTND